LNRRFIKPLLSLGITIILLMSGDEVFAAETASTARRVWDTILLLFNFGVLVFVFIKFGKKPLMDFLRGRRHEIEENLDSLDSKRQDARSRMSIEEQKLDGIEDRIQEIREAIIQAGQKAKEEIIEQGKREAEHILEKAQANAAYRLANAKKVLRKELLDIVLSLLEEKLRENLTSEDHEKLIAQFIAGIPGPKDLSDEQIKS
jgi:F-type H+-transporting ATPase subunit b